MTNWKDIHPDFTPELQKEWEDRGFSYEECKEWIDVGLEVTEVNFTDYLRKRHYNPKYSKYLYNEKIQELREEHENYSNVSTRWQKNFFSIEKIKNVLVGYTEENNLENGCETVEFKIAVLFKKISQVQKGDWTSTKINVWKPLEFVVAPAGYVQPREDNLLNDLLEEKNQNTLVYQKLNGDNGMLDNMINKLEKYKENGLCEECNQVNDNVCYNIGPHTDEEGRLISTWLHWCQSCNARHFQQDFDKWTSGNKEIDEFIQKCQLEATSDKELLEWIPYENFINIEYLAEGGFSKVYKAEWIDRCIYGRNIKNNKWARKSCDCVVVLKILNDSQNMTGDFLQEIANHKLVSSYNIVNCYGISQNPVSKNYVMVMEYIGSGSLRQYLQNSYDKLEFEDKILKLWDIANGLNSIHNRGLVHKDLHPGNILGSYITDLGLSRPVNQKNSKGKIFGVLPYVAPEVLQGNPYTQEAEVYSFGIIACEVITGLSPYVIYDEKESYYREITHDTNLVLAICNGLRPNLNLDSIPVPQLLKDLISRCWDADPLQRPKTNELYEILLNWHLEIQSKKKNVTIVIGTESGNRSSGDIEPEDEIYKYYSKSKFYHQYLEIKNTEKTIKVAKFWGDLRKFNHTLTKSSLESQSRTVHTSHLLDFKNLPQSQNSKEINEQFYSNSLAFDFTQLNLQDKERPANWIDIHLTFTPELIHSWQNLNFTVQQCKDWLNIGLTPQDFNFAAWLRDNKHLTPEQVLNHGNYLALSQEFFTNWQQTQIQQPPK